jgi:hypothetical protein
MPNGDNFNRIISDNFSHITEQLPTNHFNNIPLCVVENVKQVAGATALMLEPRAIVPIGWSHSATLLLLLFGSRSTETDLFKKS